MILALCTKIDLCNMVCLHCLTFWKNIPREQIITECYWLVVCLQISLQFTNVMPGKKLRHIYVIMTFFLDDIRWPGRHLWAAEFFELVLRLCLSTAGTKSCQNGMACPCLWRTKMQLFINEFEQAIPSGYR